MCRKNPRSEMKRPEFSTHRHAQSGEKGFDWWRRRNIRNQKPLSQYSNTRRFLHRKLYVPLPSGWHRRIGTHGCAHSCGPYETGKRKRERERDRRGAKRQHVCNVRSPVAYWHIGRQRHSTDLHCSSVCSGGGAGYGSSSSAKTVRGKRECRVL